MTGLGLWTPYVDEHEMYACYELPGDLANERAAYRPDGREMAPLSPHAFAALQKWTIEYVDVSAAEFGLLPYHYHDHFWETMVYGLTAAEAYIQSTGMSIPLVVMQMFGLALYAHDAHHCGSTLRLDAPRGMYRPDLGVNVSNEWVTTLAVNQFMKSRGVVLPARIFQTGVIWDSTYGGTVERGQRVGIPNPQPRTIWGAIMRAADVCPPADVYSWLRRSIAVTYGEVPVETPPQTLGGFIAYLYRHLGYVEYCFDRLDAVAGSPITIGLGWRRRLEMLSEGLARIAAGDQYLTTYVVKLIQAYSSAFS